MIHFIAKKAPSDLRYVSCQEKYCSHAKSVDLFTSYEETSHPDLPLIAIRLAWT